MDANRDQDSYEQLFTIFSQKVERWLLRLTFLFLALLICFQGLLQVPYVRMLLTRVDAMEGKPYYNYNERLSERK